MLNHYPIPQLIVSSPPVTCHHFSLFHLLLSAITLACPSSNPHARLAFPSAYNCPRIPLIYHRTCLLSPSLPHLPLPQPPSSPVSLPHLPP